MNDIIITPDLHTITPQDNHRYVVNLVDYFAAATGDHALTIDLTLDFAQPNVTCEIVLLYKLRDHQTLTATLVSHHISRDTGCLITARGVLNHYAKSNFTGKIVIDALATGTQSFLKHDVLVVGDKTTNISRPILQIDNNDVKASHGATTGQIDEAQLYYLTSRGISHQEACSMIVDGFLSL